MTQNPLRLSRLRKNRNIRGMLAETRLNIKNFIAPLFIHESLPKAKPIATMPGQVQFNLKSLPQEIESLSRLGIPAVLLFGIPAKKDAFGSAACDDFSIIPQAIQVIRKTNPDLLIITDLCFCEYTDHGHCGILKNEKLDHERTLVALCKQALIHAAAGADWVAPSGMIDGMVHALRSHLDKHHHQEVSILSYAVKYSSALYGPFREAAHCAPSFGDRSGHQMNPANALEAIREAELDIKEGADLIMVKPAGYYLDVIYRLKEIFPHIPLCAYQVSGEYSMIKMMIQAGLMTPEAIILESLVAIKRAKADLIISYFAKDLADILNSSES